MGGWPSAAGTTARPPGGCPSRYGGAAMSSPPPSAPVPAWGWQNGEFTPWEQCQVHVRAQALMSGAAVFEGLRAYWNPERQQSYLFRIPEHAARLAASLKVMRMRQEAPPDLTEICAELVRRNGWREDVHLVPLAYLDVAPDLGPLSPNPNEGLVITGIARAGGKALTQGFHVRVSSWARISDRDLPPRVKATANYHNSRLALLEARADGYDNALLLNQRGTVAEGPGACVMMIRDGRVVTPPLTAGILEGITRATLIQLFGERLGLAVEEREIDRTELYLADELFLCGTGAEVTPIVSVDRVPVGAGRPGELTLAIQREYFAIARGEAADHAEWRAPVYQEAAVEA
jgi:branched-chain amino acid aminotransferase